MTFGRAVIKAIKEYLSQYGFKPVGYAFGKPYTEDMTFYFYHSIFISYLQLTPRLYHNQLLIILAPPLLDDEPYLPS